MWFCSSCHDKLAPAGKCHVCGIAMSSFHRCRAMKRLVESIRLPCPNVTYGCDARPAYYARHDRCWACPHAPLRCPGMGCGFLGSTEGLLDHFTSTHGWPSPTKIGVSEVSGVLLHDGFNLVLACCSTNDDAGRGAIAGGGSQYLFLLNATRWPVGSCAITVHFLGRKQPSERLMACLVSYSRRLDDRGAREPRRRLGCCDQLQATINLGCTADFCDGLPNPDDCTQFIMPDFILGDEDKDNAIQVKAQILITDTE